MQSEKHGFINLRIEEGASDVKKRAIKIYLNLVLMANITFIKKMINMFCFTHRQASRGFLVRK